MESWLRISLLLCCFGFLRELRPSDPFATEFLSGEWRNVTSNQVNKELYPLGIYLNLSWLVIVLLVTDIVRYKPIIIVSACAGIILWSIMLWTTAFWELEIGQVFYGIYMASEVAYYTYIYAKVDKDRYQKVTGHTRAAMLSGKFLACSLAQILLSTEVMNLRDLNFISLGTQIVSLFIAIALPSVKKSIYFYATSPQNIPPRQALISTAPSSLPQLEANKTNHKSIIQNVEQQPQLQMVLANANANLEIELSPPGQKAITGNGNEYPKFSWRNAIHLLGQHIISAYSQPVVVQWSIWWALATCGQLQVVSYVQFLWKEIDRNNKSSYNGAVDAIATLLGAAGALSAGFFNSHRYKRWHLWILTICTLVEGGFLLFSSMTQSVWVAYIVYILFDIVYFFIITIASAIVAENLLEDSFGLIFGINTLVALGLQAIFTLIVVTETGFGLGIRGQFQAFGGYFVVLSGLYGIASVVRCSKNDSKPKTTQ